MRMHVHVHMYVHVHVHVHVYVYVYVYVCACAILNMRNRGLLRRKKRLKFFPDPILCPGPHPLSGPEMISNTFRHSTPSNTQHLVFRGGAAGAMDARVSEKRYEVQYRQQRQVRGVGRGKY